MTCREKLFVALTEGWFSFYIFFPAVFSVRLSKSSTGLMRGEVRQG